MKVMTRVCRVKPDLLPQLRDRCQPTQGGGDKRVVRGGAGLAAPAQGLMSASSGRTVMTTVWRVELDLLSQLRR